MIIKDRNNNEKTVKFGGNLTGVRIKGITIEQNDVEGMLSMGDKELKNYLGHISLRFTYHPKPKDQIEYRLVKTFNIEDLNGKKGIISVSSDTSQGVKVIITSFIDSTNGNIYVLSREELSIDN